MADGLSSIALLTVHVPISVKYSQSSISGKKTKVSGLIVLKGMHQYLGVDSFFLVCYFDFLLTSF